MHQVNTMDHIEDWIRLNKKIFKHLPFEESGAETILKGHLLIEEVLRELINKSITAPEALKPAQLSFHQCACICEAMFKDNENEWVWKGILNLNSIRNKMTHNLEPKGIDDLSENFIDYCRERGCGYITSASEFQFSELAMTIFEIHDVLWKILKKVLNQQLKRDAVNGAA